MRKAEILQMLLELLDDCIVVVNSDNMDLYDESPDYAVDCSLLIKRINDLIDKNKNNK